MIKNKKNAFTNFKTRYGQGIMDHPSNPTVATVKHVVDTYELAYLKILRTIQKARHNTNYAQYAKQTQLLKQIGEILAGLNSDIGQHLQQGLLETSNFITSVALDDLTALDNGLTKPETWHYDFNRNYAETAFQDANKHVAGQTNRMKLATMAMLRTETAQISRRAAVEGISRPIAYRLLKGQIASNDPDFAFTDRSGRKWASNQYFDMLTRTVMANLTRETYTNTLTNEGHDLVKITTQGSKDKCRLWEGKVISLTGKTKGYPSMAQAIKSGEIFHPRCRHSFVAYDPEIEEIFKAT